MIIQKKSLADMIAETLKQQITGGIYRVGINSRKGFIFFEQLSSLNAEGKWLSLNVWESDGKL